MFSSTFESFLLTFKLKHFIMLTRDCPMSTHHFEQIPPAPYSVGTKVSSDVTIVSLAALCRNAFHDATEAEGVSETYKNNFRGNLIYFNLWASSIESSTTGELSVDKRLEEYPDIADSFRAVLELPKTFIVGGM